jgi:sortase A
MQVSDKAKWKTRRGAIWALGNVLIVAGLFALLYVGGLYAYVEGRSLLQRPQVETPQIRRAPALELAPTPTPLPNLPVLNQPFLVEEAAAPAQNLAWRSTAKRIVIPSIEVDSPVIAVGWHQEELNGQSITVWDVAKFAVGHHYGSGNPGDGTNIVMAGHVAGRAGAVFLRLIELQPGDEVVLYADEQQYLYVVEEVLLVLDAGQPLEERLRNAQYMAPTDWEQLTLITCWPVHVYDHRLIVLARPYQAEPFPRPDFVEN